MTRLNSPKRKSLSRADFEAHPIWVWDEDSDVHLPIADQEPSPEEDGPLFIKARFESHGRLFDGYLIGGSTFYAFGLFVEDHEFVMNLNTPDWMDKYLLEICAILQCEPFKLFPLRFESPVRFKGGRVISGSLQP